ncbi:MAG: DUF1173 family protein [Pseudomonadota bacterium]
MQTQRLSIRGRVFGADDPAIQSVLAQVHHSAERPRCLCVPGGIEMYVSRRGTFLAKRMPDTGGSHHPGCVSYEPDPASSGPGELLGDALRESPTGEVELSVDFPWTRMQGSGRSRRDARSSRAVEEARRRISLHEVMHFLFERARFNRWTPAMEGKRNQGVLHKYLTEAAQDVRARGVSLAQRLYVPEPFSEATHSEAVRRRRARLDVLRPIDGCSPLALVLGEFKTIDTRGSNHRVWIRHMPDVPLLVAGKTWRRIEKGFAPLFEARDAGSGGRVRLIMAALIRARREHTYELDAASLMLTSEHWIPVEGVHELPLVQMLVRQQRRFLKPLRYDARAASRFANVLLLDAGAAPIALHVLSPFMTAKERDAKEAAVRSDGRAWVWPADEIVMPALPAPSP